MNNMKKKISAEFKKSGKPITYYAELLGVTRKTVYNRMESPRLFSFNDIKLLQKNGVELDALL